MSPAPAGLTTHQAVAWRRERREAARRWHPDRGGTDAELLAALAAVDARYGAGAPLPAAGGASGERVVVVDLDSLPARLLVWWRRAWQRVRRRHYIDI